MLRGVCVLYECVLHSTLHGPSLSKTDVSYTGGGGARSALLSSSTPFYELSSTLICWCLIRPVLIYFQTNSPVSLSLSLSLSCFHSDDAMDTLHNITFSLGDDNDKLLASSVSFYLFFFFFHWEGVFFLFCLRFSGEYRSSFKYISLYTVDRAIKLGWH